MIRPLQILGLALGLAVVGWLVWRTDSQALLAAFGRIGWGFAAILAARGATILADCAAWRALLPGRERPRFSAMLPLRWISESINTTLPVAQVGGEVARARLLQRLLATPGHGAASVAVDFCLSLFAQVLFTLIGLVLLARFGGAAGWWPALLTASLVPIFAVAVWELLVRGRLLLASQQLAERWGRRRVAGALQSLRAALGLLAKSPSAIAVSLFFHGMSLLGHAAEVWLTLALMGAWVGFADAVLLESLSLAVRSAAFLIPSGWGAQEASLVALAGASGLTPEAALALGLVKRAREFAIGLPGLAAWGIAEARIAAALRG